MSGRLPRMLLLLITSLACTVETTAAASDNVTIASAITRPRIALIIDDLGYGLAAGRRAIELPGPVACAVLPATPRARDLAEFAARQGKEVLLHLPLQAQNADHSADPGVMHLDMSRERFAAAFAESIAAVPHASGVNNHRGSLLTRHPGHMRWLMEELHAREGLFFVDSFTTHQSIALQAAIEAGVPAARRDVFLDSDRSAAGVAAAFERLKKLARRRGSAIGIGHPYPETLEFLEQALPELYNEGIELVRLSDIIYDGD
ncbi:MAG: divergent polysaccharide deacetylase family protein [Woeseia sp.]|nr:divergent polysaccharide deacetylase family protein [Woeseia sp.]MBT8096848.1 divergent polysaccharide deacetylase family protein [Woeseia sp.]NNE59614.1 divergent polysaccharide deacetylase family protein [Woeseia sp.]NNL55765.1 divergent polysaccharide deacetylase family protein [Woeseia sp.]